jgi:hypothetical protein
LRQNPETGSIREEGRRERVKILSGTFSSIQGKMPQRTLLRPGSWPAELKMAVSWENALNFDFFCLPERDKTPSVASSHSIP